MKKRIIIVISLIGIILIITLATVLKIKETDTQNKYQFIIDNFIFYSKKCIQEQKCNNNIVTIKELYDLGYIEKQINPKTNKYFNDKSYIKILNYDFVLVE